MANEWHAEWLREGVKSWNKRRKKVQFEPDLRGVNFFSFLPPDFRDAPKTSRYFERIDLRGANLDGADLSNLNFSNAKFDGASLSGADMSKTNFTRASFRNSDLSNANTNRAVFNRAVFEGSNLVEVDLRRVEMQSATFISVALDEHQKVELDNRSIRVFESRTHFNAEIKMKSEKRRSVSDSVFEGRKAVEIDNKTRKNRYDVFFGTNRNIEFARGEVVNYGADDARELSYGVCEVIVPDNKPIGSIGSRLFKKLFNKSSDKLRVDEIVSLNEELFFEFLQQSYAQMEVKANPTVFIHGYNNSFQEAVVRAAQIGVDLGIGQGVALFSWPSKGKTLSYAADEAMAETSKYYLADFIERFVRDAPGSKINLIAHSMGCRCLMGAIEVLSAGRQGTLDSIDQLILAAADVDTRQMPFLAKHAVNSVNRATSYASGKDRALQLSGWLHSFSRVGLTPPAFVFGGIDTVVVNNDDLGMLSHQYVGTNRDVLSDVFTLLTQNLPPTDRFALEPVRDGGKEYWRIKE